MQGEENSRESPDSFPPFGHMDSPEAGLPPKGYPIVKSDSARTADVPPASKQQFHPSSATRQCFPNPVWRQSRHSASRHFQRQRRVLLPTQRNALGIRRSTHPKPKFQIHRRRLSLA